MSEELDRLRAEIKDLKETIHCEGMDPNGTIWDHAKKVQAENERLEDRVEAMEDVVFRADQTIKATTRPVMVDPFNMEWKWHSRLQNALDALRKIEG